LRIGPPDPRKCIFERCGCGLKIVEQMRKFRKRIGVTRPALRQDAAAVRQPAATMRKVGTSARFAHAATKQPHRGMIAQKVMLAAEKSRSGDTEIHWQQYKYCSAKLVLDVGRWRIAVVISPCRNATLPRFGDRSR